MPQAPVSKRNNVYQIENAEMILVMLPFGQPGKYQSSKGEQRPF